MSDSRVDLSAVRTTFDALASFFALRDTYNKREVRVPTNDGRYVLAFRKDAFSQDALVLEMQVETATECPPLMDTEGRPFFDPPIAAVIVVDQNTGVVKAGTRCQHFLRRNSPRALFDALVPLRAYLSDDATRRMYAVQRKFQDASASPERRFAVGERFALQSAVDNSLEVAAQLSNDVPAPYTEAAPWWQWLLLVAIVAAVLVGVSLLTYFVARRVLGPVTSSKLKSV